MSENSLKRSLEKENEEDVIGPKPSEATEQKKQKSFPLLSFYCEIFVETIFSV